MHKKLGPTFIYVPIVTFCIAYLATMAIVPGAPFAHIFYVVSMATFVTFLAALVQHSIWFQNQITGHIIESIDFAVIAGAIFGVACPAA